MYWTLYNVLAKVFLLFFFSLFWLDIRAPWLFSSSTCIFYLFCFDDFFPRYQFVEFANCTICFFPNQHNYRLDIKIKKHIYIYIYIYIERKRGEKRERVCVRVTTCACMCVYACVCMCMGCVCVWSDEAFVCWHLTSTKLPVLYSLKDWWQFHWLVVRLT